MDDKDTAFRGNEHSVTIDMSESTNNGGKALSDGSQRLSLGTAAGTALPASSPVSSPLRSQQRNASSSTPGIQEVQNSPLRRTPSSSSISTVERTKTPTLQKRSSVTSLHSVGAATPPRTPVLRRTSSNLAPLSSPGGATKSELPATVEEPPPPVMTAASVARDYFGKELGIHRGEAGDPIDPKTVVILQDNCYGHRYSRPRTSRAGLSSIVERPERIHASILGLSTAYVRLGGRHAEGHSPPQPQRHSKEPPPFKVCKTRRTLPLTSQAVTNVHGLKWMNELKAMCDAAETKLALNGKELARPTSTEQTNGNVNIEKPKLHEGDLYLCSESLEALEGALGGVCEGIDAVFNESNAKRAFVCIRPPGHHCSADYPSGFCWLNNVHVGIGHAALTHNLTHAAIIDFDLHHGDGSQSITWAHNDRMASLPKNTPVSKKTAIGYFSLHDINSYPCEMGDEEKVRNASLCLENAHGQTIWNVHLQPWKTESDFWKLYDERYMVLLSKARSFLRSHTDRLRQSPMHPQPKAAIFLSAGFDASEWESPGMQRHQVNVPTDFYARFTRDVVRLAEEEGLGVDGRVISVLEGGYSDRALMSGVLGHLSGLTSGDQPSALRPLSSGLGQDMARRLGNLHINAQVGSKLEAAPEQFGDTFDTNWWALERLEEVENLINPPATAAAPKKQRPAIAPTYSSTTQSFSAKVVSPQTGRRSLSGSASHLHSSPTSSPKMPEQPPPPVSWATAAHELSKLLIPSDRQTKSMRPEELNAEATRVRKARHSTIGLPTEALVPAPTIDATSNSKRMQLRDRTSKASNYASEEDEKPLSKANRRKTIADPALLVESTESVPPKPIRASPRKPSVTRGRRVSDASSMNSTNGEITFGTSLDSLIVGQPRKDPLTFKKPRIPSETRPDVQRPKPARKPPPVPRVPPTYSVAANSAPGVPQADQAPLAPNSDRQNQDLDSLASGMKKMSIKLNLPPKEIPNTKEAKQKPPARGRPKAAVPKVAGPPRVKKSTTDEKMVVANETANAIQESEVTQGSSIGGDHVLPGEDHTSVVQSEAPVTKPGSKHDPILPSPPPSDTPPHADPTKSPTSSNLAMPPTFEAPSMPSIPISMNQIRSTKSIQASGHGPDQLTSHEPDQVVPGVSPKGPKEPVPATVQSPIPSTPKRTRHDLPVFSATSPIFFGKPKQEISGHDEGLSANDASQDQPSATPSTQLIGASVTPEVDSLPRGISQSGPYPAEPKEERPVESSIWDVPETPESRR